MKFTLPSIRVASPQEVSELPVVAERKTQSHRLKIDPEDDKHLGPTRYLRKPETHFRNHKQINPTPWHLSKIDQNSMQGWMV